MSSSRRYSLGIHVRVDVEIRDHERAQAAGAAMATWLWALCHTRAKELDGFVPRASIRGCFVGERRGLADMARLVEVGLAVAVDHSVHGSGWDLVNYASKNETKSDIESRRLFERNRKATQRGTQRIRATATHVPVGHPRDNFGTPGGTPTVVPTPESESEVETDHSPSQACAPARAHVAESGPRIADLSPPTWAGEVVDAVAMSTGRRLEDLAGVWAVFAAWQAARGLATDRAAWTLWVTREARRSAGPAPARAIPTGPPDLAELRLAFESGIREVLPAVSVEWSPRADQALARAVDAHARSRSTGERLEGERRSAWVHAVAALYAEHVRDEPGEARFLGPPGTPTALERWLNADAARREADAVDGSTKRRRA